MQIILKFLDPLVCVIRFIKLLQKTKVNRLKPILETLIGPCQSSFLKGRRSTDNSIIIHEVFNILNIQRGKVEVLF